jgi:non-ribosomal peptide synthetase component F
VREVGALYRAYAAGEESALAELALQYADFAVWQRHWLQGAVLAGQLEYWRRQLGGELPVLELATDRVRPAVQSQRGALQAVRLNEELSGQLKELSRREGVTLFMVLLAAWQTLLFRYTGQQDVVVGTDIANRNQGATEGLIGFFINQLVMRTDLSGEPSFRELLRRVREVCLGAYAHQDVPFEKLVEELQPERQLARAPLFQVKLVLQNTPVDVLELPGLQLRPLRQETNTAKLDMILTLAEGTDRISGQLEYNTDLFDAAWIEQMMGRFSRLLQSIVDRPDSLLDELEFLTEPERLQQSSRRREREEIAMSKLMRARRQTV